MNWAGHVAKTEECRSDFKILTDKVTVRRPQRMLRDRWDDSIRMELKKEICQYDAELILLGMRVVGETM